MTDDEIRVLRASEQTLRTPDESRIAVEALAAEALRRGEEIALLKRGLDNHCIIDAERLAAHLQMEKHIARLEAALRMITDHAEAVCADPAFVNVLGQPLCRSCEDVLPAHGEAASDCIGWAGQQARAALA